MLALGSDFFWTLFQSKMLNASSAAVDLGPDLPFDQQAWETVLGIIHGTMDAESLKSSLDIGSCIQLLHACQYLQIFGVEYLLFPCFQKYWQAAFETVEIDPEHLLECCVFFEGSLIKEWAFKVKDDIGANTTFWLQKVLQFLSSDVELDFTQLS